MVMFSFFMVGLILGFGIAALVYSNALDFDEIKSNLFYEVVHSNQKTTLLEEQTVGAKQILVETSMFANRPIGPGDIVVRAQRTQTTSALNIDFVPLLKKGEEVEILKEIGINV